MNIHIHEIQLKRGSSYIETPNWIKPKQAIINLKNTHDNYCFAHSIVIALYHKQIGKNPQRIENLKPYYKHFNWEGINTPATKKDWKRFENNNPDVSLNIFSVPFNEEEIRTEYVSKFNRERNSQVTLLMITDEIGKWHYTTLKSIETSNGTLKPIKSYSRLMKGYSSKYKDDFYCYNCGNSYRTDRALAKHELLCEKDKNIGKHSMGSKMLKHPYSACLDIDAVQPKHDTCSNDPTKSYTQVINSQIPSAYAFYTVDQYGENKLQCESGENCIKSLVKNINEYAMDIFNRKTLEMGELTEEELASYGLATICWICNRPFNNDKEKKYIKVRDHDHYTGKYRGAAHSQCNLNYSEQRILTINMHGGSNYDFHMIIKELAREFDTVSVLPENTEKYISISIPRTLKKINNKVEDKDFVYHIRFNDTYRFLTKSLSAAVDDLSEINDPLQCLKCSERFKKYDNFCYFDKLRSNVLGYKCEKCDAFRRKSFATVKKKKKIKSTYSFSQNHNKDDTQKDIDEKFLLLSKNKGVYPYEYMDSFEKLEKTELPEYND